MNLQDQAKSIIVGKGSKASKKAALIKLGLRPIDADTLFFVYAAELAAAQAENRKPNLDSLIAGLTFGVEFECCNAPRTAMRNAFTSRGLSVENIERYANAHLADSSVRYKLVPDGSISGNDTLECVTPVLSGANTGFASLKACTEAIQSVGAGVNKSTGTHVHIGYADMTDEHYINVFKNYQRLEYAIDLFMAESRRLNHSHWCKTLCRIDFSNCHTKDDVRAKMNCDRYYKVNAESYGRHRTIEFRQHQGTINYDKISMWVRFCLKLVVWSKDNVLTNHIRTIDEIPFLNADEKRFFNERASQLAGRA